MGNGKIRKWLGIGTVIGALGLGYGAGIKQENINLIIPQNAHILQKNSIETSNHYIKFKTEYDLINSKSFNLEDKTEVDQILKAMNRIISDINKTLEIYKLGYDKQYDFLKNGDKNLTEEDIQNLDKYRIDYDNYNYNFQYKIKVIEYFNYALDSLKTKYKENSELQKFKLSIK